MKKSADGDTDRHPSGGIGEAPVTLPGDEQRTDLRKVPDDWCRIRQKERPVAVENAETPSGHHHEADADGGDAGEVNGEVECVAGETPRQEPGDRTSEQDDHEHGDSRDCHQQGADGAGDRLASRRSSCSSASL